MMSAEGGGRANQKLRTRKAIVDAARELIRTGAPVTMPEVARAALVSEVTAYRYFADLPLLIGEAIIGLWPTAAEALEPVASSDDPVERVAFAAEVFLRGVAAYQGGVRATIAATITNPAMARARPYVRGELIDLALEPLPRTLVAADPDALAALKQELVAVISAETLFCLTDRLGLDVDDAVARIVRMAVTITTAAIGDRSPAVR
jgi:AcrR family transcriptional regulator